MRHASDKHLYKRFWCTKPHGHRLGMRRSGRRPERNQRRERHAFIRQRVGMMCRQEAGGRVGSRLGSGTSLTSTEGRLKHQVSASDGGSGPARRHQGRERQWVDRVDVRPRFRRRPRGNHARDAACPHAVAPNVSETRFPVDVSARPRSSTHAGKPGAALGLGAEPKGWGLTLELVAEG